MSLLLIQPVRVDIWSQSNCTQWRFLWVFAGKDIYMGLLELTSSHVILSSGFLGQNCASVIKNNHWLGRKIAKWKGTVCFINKSCDNHSVAARGNEENHRWDDSLVCTDRCRQNTAIMSSITSQLPKGLIHFFFFPVYLVWVCCNVKKKSILHPKGRIPRKLMLQRDVCETVSKSKQLW